jgi:hypothetical protein
LSWDLPRLKRFYPCLWLSLLQWKTLPQEKTLIIELGESQPCVLQHF